MVALVTQARSYPDPSHPFKAFRLKWQAYGEGHKQREDIRNKGMSSTDTGKSARAVQVFEV